MAYAAEQYWKPPFQMLGTSSGRDGLVTILSCHTGAKANGAMLLFKIAAHLGRPVRARTGFTYCKDGILSFETGSEWQEAAPGATVPPVAIEPPKRPARTPAGAIKLAGVQLDRSQITAVEVRNRLFNDEAPWIELQKTVTSQLIQQIEFDQPDYPGEPLAIETARIRIRFGELLVREFVIYNDRLLQDTTAPTNFYYTQPDFSLLLRAALQ